MSARLTAIAPALLLLLALAPSAAAGPQVPPVGPVSLPVAGTCAPIERDRTLWVTVGEEGWYRVDADETDVDARRLADVLARRAEGAARDGRALDVWIVVDKARPWGHVVKVLLACQQYGLFRVGLQVRAEGGEGLFGFPLFLPPPENAPAGASPGMAARRLDVRLEVPPPRTSPPPTPSDPSRLYAAARAAVERFGPVVADASIPVNAPVQQAVTAVDYLYRAGCAAVKLPYRLMVRGSSGPPTIEIWVEDRLLEAEPIDVALPPIAPRKTPWPDDGAAQPGAHRFVLEDIPDPRRPVGAPPVADALQPLPSYAERGELPPGTALRAADEQVRSWAGTVGTWLARALRPGAVVLPETLLVRRKRQGMGAQEFLEEARATFPAPESVDVNTVRVQAYLFEANRIVGQIDLTLDVTGPGLAVVFARWVGGPYPTDLVLPPRPTDPYAAGVPGHVRVWLEGLLAAARTRGAGALPLASEASVLAGLPPVAHAGVRTALAQRQQGIDNLAAWLRATRYDRVSVLAAEGSAAVHRGGRIEGILRFDLEPELGAWSLASLKTRVAPR